MGEAQSLARVIMLVGFLSVFGITFYAWAGTTSGPPPFSNLGAFPTFNNPFTPGQIASLTKPDANDVLSLTSYESVHGCLDASYWTCVEKNDGDNSYIVLNTTSDLGGSYLAVHMRNLVGGDITQITLTIWCRSVGTPTSIDNVAVAGQPTFIVSPCPLSDTYQPVVVVMQNLVQPFPLATFNAGSISMLIRNHRSNGGLNGAPDPNAGVGRAFITYMELSVTQNSGPSATDCAGNIFQVTGCQLARIVQAFSTGLQFAFNTIVYVFSWALYIGGVFGALVGILLWYLNIPGTPPFAQALLDTMIFGVMGFIVYLMAKFIRGMGGV